MWQLSREGIERESFPFQQFEQSGLFACGRAAEKTKSKPSKAGSILGGGARWQLSREGIERESVPFQQFEQSGLFARGRAAEKNKIEAQQSGFDFERRSDVATIKERD